MGEIYIYFLFLPWGADSCEWCSKCVPCVKNILSCNSVFDFWLLILEQEEPKTLAIQQIQRTGFITWFSRNLFTVLFFCSRNMTITAWFFLWIFFFHEGFFRYITMPEWGYDLKVLSRTWLRNIKRQNNYSKNKHNLEYPRKGFS